MARRTIAERVADAEARAKLARLQREEREDRAKTRLLTKLHKVSARYDSLESSHDSQRIQPKTERLPEDDQYNARKKLKGVALGRDLQRNVSSFKTLLHQFEICVVGSGPKVQFNTGTPAWDKAASSWFNSDWAKWCDGVDDSPLSDQVAMALSAVKREGDILCVFDDFDRNDGTLRWYEADQLVNIDPEDWKRSANTRGFPWREKVPGGGNKLVPMIQKNGLVLDYRGRVVAYVVCADHGLSVVKMDKATIIPRWNQRWNPGGSAKLLKAPWRLSQRRGQGEALTVSNQLSDIYEMIAAELQSGKNMAQRSAAVTVDKDAEGGVMRAMLAAGMSEADIDKILYGDGSNKGSFGTQYDQLEGTFGGRVDYLQPGESLQINDHDRPSSSVRDFGGYIQELSGSSMGLGRSRSTLKAETAYTAFRGEELMSWQTFEADQKKIERRLMDFLVYKSVSWALARGELQGAPDAWWRAAVFTWPKMREVDEAKTAKAQETKLKNGTMTYADIFGPERANKFAQYSEELEQARQLKLPLAVFEAKSGGAAPDTNNAEGDMADE